MNKNNISPVFIFSLPRTGSTLLQRILMGHSKISSFAEPHFLLPFIYATKKEGTLTSYSHLSSHKAISDVLKNLPNGEQDYNTYLREFSLKIYKDLADEKSIFFIDKTPVYVWIIPDIIKIFPDAKFIFLFRSPIQVYASIISTFSGNNFKHLYRFKKYLDEGFNVLSDAYKEYRDRSIAINFKDLIAEPDVQIRRLCEYLGVDRERGMIREFSTQDLKGRSVDPTGTKNYVKLRKEPLEKWKGVFNSPYRKKVLLRFLEELPEENLELQGYDKKVMIDKVKQYKPGRGFGFLRDFIHYHSNSLVIRLNLNLLLAENMKWTRNIYIN